MRALELGSLLRKLEELIIGVILFWKYDKDIFECHILRLKSIVHVWGQQKGGDSTLGKASGQEFSALKTVRSSRLRRWRWNNNIKKKSSLQWIFSLGASLFQWNSKFYYKKKKIVMVRVSQIINHLCQTSFLVQLHGPKLGEVSMKTIYPFNLPHRQLNIARSHSQPRSRSATLLFQMLFFPRWPPGSCFPDSHSGILKPQI